MSDEYRDHYISEVRDDGDAWAVKTGTAWTLMPKCDVDVKPKVGATVRVYGPPPGLGAAYPVGAVLVTDDNSADYVIRVPDADDTCCMNCGEEGNGYTSRRELHSGRSGCTYIACIWYLRKRLGALEIKDLASQSE